MSLLIVKQIQWQERRQLMEILFDSSDTGSMTHTSPLSTDMHPLALLEGRQMIPMSITTNRVFPMTAEEHMLFK
eukprot:13671008-Ditylum_brightwellii.AAC.1